MSGYQFVRILLEGGFLALAAAAFFGRRGGRGGRR